MLEIKNLCLDIDLKSGKKEIIKNISFKVDPGDRICLIGPSGAGKTTLLRCINLLETPTSGQIIFKGKSILENSVDVNKIRSEIGMIFQHFNLFTHLTVKKNITLAPIHVKKMDKKEAENLALEYLNKVKLQSKADEYPIRLSGGEKQRIAIVRALIMSPKLLLVDEPTSALDPKTSLEVSNLFKNFIDQNIAVICITHDMEFLRNFATKIIYMKQGQIKYDGPLNEENLKNFEFD